MRPSTINHVSVAAMTRAILEGPSTIPEISYECGLSYVTVRRYVHALHKQKCVHIASWDHDTRGRRTLRSWAMGDKPDAKRPPPIKHSERQRRLRERATGLQKAIGALA